MMASKLFSAIGAHLIANGNGRKYLSTQLAEPLHRLHSAYMKNKGLQNIKDKANPILLVSLIHLHLPVQLKS